MDTETLPRAICAQCHTEMTTVRVIRDEQVESEVRICTRCSYERSYGNLAIPFRMPEVGV